MYASAMKCCGAVEVCGIGTTDYDKSWSEPDWSGFEAQVSAQNSGVAIAFAKDGNPKDRDQLIRRGFIPFARFVNPRTKNRLTSLILPTGDSKHEFALLAPGQASETVSFTRKGVSVDGRKIVLTSIEGRKIVLDMSDGSSIGALSAACRAVASAEEMENLARH